MSQKSNDPSRTPAKTEPLVVSEKVFTNLQGETVKLKNRHTNQVCASNVDTQNGIAGQVTAETFTAENSLVGIVHGKTINTKDSLVGVVSARDPNLQGVIGLSIGQETNLVDSRAGIIISRKIHSNHIQSVLVIASEVDGTIEVLADHRSIALFGLATGVALGIVFSVFRLIRGR